jgi:hypothetical protein
MLISPFVHLPVTVGLAVIVVVAGGAVAASRWRDGKTLARSDDQTLARSDDQRLARSDDQRLARR